MKRQFAIDESVPNEYAVRQVSLNEMPPPPPPSPPQNGVACESSIIPIKFHLGGNRYLTVSIFKGQKYVHFREYEFSDNACFPTKKGIALPARRFASLLQKCNEINETVQQVENGISTQYKVHIGGGVFVTVNGEYQRVDVRAFFVPPGQAEEKATCRGMAFKLCEWKKFIEVIPRLLEMDTEIASTLPCYLEAHHPIIVEQTGCCECAPFDANVIRLENELFSAFV